MSDAALRLYDLLAPQFLAGFKFSDSVNKILDKVTVSDLQSASDSNAILYTGTAQINADATSKHSSGAVFDWKKDAEIQFRLRIPRKGSTGIQDVIKLLPASGVLSELGDPSENDSKNGSDYPGLSFRLELLFKVLTFHLGDSWNPATFDTGLRVVKNSTFKREEDNSTDVRICGPKMLFRYDQGEDFDESTDFEVAAWGDPGFDAPNDLCEGELATMDPPLAIHKSERFAFGFDEIVLDLSEDNTPAEILEKFFGTDESFKGLYAKSLQVYYADKDKDLALNFVVRDALISFSGEVSLEAEVDLVLAGATSPTVDVQFLEGNKKIPYNWGKTTDSGNNTWSGGSATITSSTILRLQITGGPAAYTPKVTFKPETGTSIELWNSGNNLAQFNSLLPSNTDFLRGSLTISIQDSKPAEIYSNTLALKITATEQPSSSDVTSLQYVPSSSKKPSFIRRLSIRLRLDKNIPAYIEVSGELDIKTATDVNLRESINTYADMYNQIQSDTLNPKTKPNISSKNPADGVIDFLVNVTYDTATGVLSETLMLGAAPGDKDGLAFTQDVSKFNDILGAVLVLTPILDTTTEALAPEYAGDWTAIGTDLAVPVLLGLTNRITTACITLYGGELKLRQNIADHPELTNAALTFDYEVAFGIDFWIVRSEKPYVKPIRVRYKAVGINLNFSGGDKFEIVFDTTKGYKLDMSDPGLFTVGGSTLGNILKIAAARIAKVNPATLEFDLALKANLGVITVDRFQIKITLEDPPQFTILPSGIKVNIPGTMTGSGSINIKDEKIGGFKDEKIGGSLDLTLVPLRLRIAADVMVDHVKTQDSREATAVYASMRLDFPSPVVLGNSGLGLYGFAGLFGMHYGRNLNLPCSTPTGYPELDWLSATKGEPQNLKTEEEVYNWVPQIDNWAFGAGVRLGSLDGGYVLNLSGMMILELPGPRILITVKLQVLEKMPSQLKDAGLDAGILGLLDLDFLNNRIIIGVVANYSLKDLITIRIPVEVYFSWDQDLSTWHAFFGTIDAPCSAKVLGIVKGAGYLMISSGVIKLPTVPQETELSPVAVAVGVSASVLWGSERYAIYVKVALSANLGISFAPHVFIVGSIQLEGELRLIIISIGVSGNFTVTTGKQLIEDPSGSSSYRENTHLEVSVCGEIKVLFIRFKKCVTFSLGSEPDKPSPPPLIRGMYLQSYAPVIAQGQGGGRPIDASLGNAVPVGETGVLPIVPIDSVPVLQFQYGVEASGVDQQISADSIIFDDAIKNCLTNPGADGVDLGGGNRKAHYSLKKVTLEARDRGSGDIIDPPIPDPPAGKVPVVWRPYNKPGGDTPQSLVDLALFSRIPDHHHSALERSDVLTRQLLSRWGDVCAPVAPPASVFWTFCGQRAGASHDGWTLFGSPSPDPEGTVRSSPVPTRLRVEQPDFTSYQHLLAGIGPGLGVPPFAPAKVITAPSLPDYPLPGTRRVTGVAVELPELLPDTITTTLPQTLNEEGYKKLRRDTEKTLATVRWLRFRTGPSMWVRILMALNKPLHGHAFDTENPWVVIRELGAEDRFIKEQPLGTLNKVTISEVTDLPPGWQDPAGPWFLQAGFVTEYLMKNMIVLLVTIHPDPRTSCIEIAVTAPLENRQLLVLQVGAVEALLSCETSRAADAAQIQSGTIDSLNTYLYGNTPVPLLRRNTEYTVTVDYDVIITTEPDAQLESQKQAFRFQTDDIPPESIEPWVLCTFPDNNEEHVFTDDPVRIVLNDSSIIQLYNQYGYNLQMILRAADGCKEPFAPIKVEDYPPVDGIGTATYDSLRQMIIDGISSGRLSCFGSIEIPCYPNQIIHPDATLKPLMGYTLDINRVPTDPDVSASGESELVFRRFFSTSRFPSLMDLADDLGKGAVAHRFLDKKLFPDFVPDSTPQVIRDQDIQDAFTAAGEQALPAPDTNRIVIYWGDNGNGTWSPDVILIDSTEPLWRWRKEPGFEAPDPYNDPSFKIVTIAPVPALEVVATDGAAISGFLHSPGGTRTIIVLSPFGGGMTVSLALHRPLSKIFDISEVFATIKPLVIGPEAPWENDYV